MIAPEDQGRAYLYRLLARLLAAAPDAATLGLLRGLGGDGSPVGGDLQGLAGAAATAGPGALEREYHDLFIGVGRGELVPFGSWYLAGFLHEKPLAHLRRDLGTLGLGRTAGTKEPEDHVASLCEAMALLIEGKGDLGAQKAFFERHLEGWAPAFFADLERARAARFYAAVGRLGARLMTLERDGFAFVEGVAA
ncbi:MAG: molecular chaperone TorD family protein [Geminicoccaceae bacterium]|nr:molecular chaperone TorD family protein [Geminicoccaceae bacterium]